MADLFGGGLRIGGSHKLYACHDYLLQHKEALFSHLTARWRDLFNANFDVLLYDLREVRFARNLGIRRRGRKACILLVSCRSVTNFVKMELLGVFKRNSGRVRRSVMATTSSEGGDAGRRSSAARSPSAQEFQTSRG